MGLTTIQMFFKLKPLINQKQHQLSNLEFFSWYHFWQVIIFWLFVIILNYLVCKIIHFQLYLSHFNAFCLHFSILALSVLYSLIAQSLTDFSSCWVIKNSNCLSTNSSFNPFSSSNSFILSQTLGLVKISETVAQAVLYRFFSLSGL